MIMEQGSLQICNCTKAKFDNYGGLQSHYTILSNDLVRGYAISPTNPSIESKALGPVYI